jgi:hypothetical protein
LKKNHQVLVIGGGWAGVSAALSARLAGADVAICERTDMLLGAGLVGGIMRNNGRFVATEEALAMGCGDLFKITDGLSRHKNVSFPGHLHANLYDVMLIEPAVRALLDLSNISVYFGERIVGAKATNGRLMEVIAESEGVFSADAFVDATGSSGPPGQCQRLGHGCASCIQRCPSFGPRVSVTQLMGLKEFMCSRRKGTFGAMSGSCKLHKETLSQYLREELDSKGVLVVHLPEKLTNSKKLETKVCQQYALPEYAENLILLDTGHAKLMSPYFPLSALRSVPGFENARYADPLAGDRGNSIRLTAVSPRDTTLLVHGTQNLFVAGERAGVCVGHTEAIVTGAVAGRNASLSARGKPLLIVPQTLAIGDYIALSGVNSSGEPLVPEGYGLRASHTFSGSVYFERMKSLDLYQTDPDVIWRRVKESGMESAFLEA